MLSVFMIYDRLKCVFFCQNFKNIKCNIVNNKYKNIYTSFYQNGCEQQ